MFSFIASSSTYVYPAELGDKRLVMGHREAGSRCRDGRYSKHLKPSLVKAVITERYAANSCWTSLEHDATQNINLDFGDETVVVVVGSSWSRCGCDYAQKCSLAINQTLSKPPFRAAVKAHVVASCLLIAIPKLSPFNSIFLVAGTPI